jgi:hypothetical protein
MNIIFLYGNNIQIYSTCFITVELPQLSAATYSHFNGSYTKKCLENRNFEKFFIVPGGFEPPSQAPKACRIDHYPTGLLVLAT